MWNVSKSFEIFKSREVLHIFKIPDAATLFKSINIHVNPAAPQSSSVSVSPSGEIMEGSSVTWSKLLDTKFVRGLTHKTNFAAWRGYVIYVELQHSLFTSSSGTFSWEETSSVRKRSTSAPGHSLPGGIQVNWPWLSDSGEEVWSLSAGMKWRTSPCGGSPGSSMQMEHFQVWEFFILFILHAAQSTSHS